MARARTFVQVKLTRQSRSFSFEGADAVLVDYQDYH
jgi:hypothetical protein